MPASSLDQVVSLCKRRGFIFPGSEIYGGMANTWDYGHLGAVLKENVRRWWLDRFVLERDDMVLIDASILMNPKVWEASGHVANFNDAMADCRECKKRFRADHLIEDKYPDVKVEGKSTADLTGIIQQRGIPCPNCGAKNSFTDVRAFNLLLRTQLGAINDGTQPDVYLRGEIAQAMFVNFKNVLTATRRRLPFGIASIGKAFRNEVTPGNFTFRTLEFDLMEFEYFIREGDWSRHFDYWLQEEKNWLADIGISQNKIRVREHAGDELSHYSKKTVDVEYDTPFGWKELFGLAYRTDFDLSNHMESSGKDLAYTDPDTSEKFVPHVIEPTFGLSRLVLIILIDSYNKERLENGEERVVMKLHPRIAPVQVAVLPLSKDPGLIEKAREVHGIIRSVTKMRTDFDVTGSIGKRYRRQDEIGTPRCVTVDFGTIGKDSQQCREGHVTVRDRDTLKQEEIRIDELANSLA